MDSEKKLKMREEFPDYRPQGHGPGINALIGALTVAGYDSKTINTLLEYVREDFRDEIRAARVLPPISKDELERNEDIERVIGKLNFPKICHCGGMNGEHWRRCVDKDSNVG